MKVLVAGGTGMVGAELLAQLAGEASPPAIIELVRREVVAPAGVESLVVDFAKLEAVEVGQADVAFCALGTTIGKAGSKAAFYAVDHDAVVAFAELAKRAGVHTFVLVSSLGSDADSRAFYTKTKGEVERAVAALGFAHLIVVRPSILDGNRTESRPAEAVGLVLLRAFAPLMVGGLRQYRPSRATDVAAAMRAAARAPGEAAVRYVDGAEIPRLAQP